MLGRLLLLLALSSHTRGQSGPLVATKKGLIRGSREGNLSVFLGIPYAKVRRDNPFGAPIPHSKFDIVYEATGDPPPCPQMSSGRPAGTLDCLRLNIFAPNTPTPRKLPVIVYIYGGTFISGYANGRNFRPKRLADDNLIVVTVNYRVGPYGFMCLDTAEVPGNQGIKDQVEALRWVKENIASFGGDVDRITLMGESAGAASIDVHLLTEGEKLFHQVILQSGTIYKPGNVMDSNRNLPIRLAEKLGFSTSNFTQALKYLADSDTDSVIKATSDLGLKFSLCIEKRFDGVESVLTDSPINLGIPKVEDMKVLAGFNSREGLVMNAINSTGFLNNPNFFRDALAHVFDDDQNFKGMEDNVRKFYIADEPLTEDVRKDIIDFQSDFFYSYPLQRDLDKFLSSNAGNIYQYLFSYEGSLNYIKNVRNITLEGACHGDELGYLFDLVGNDRAPSRGDLVMIERMSKIWENFAIYGNPAPQKTDLVPVTWTPITNDTIPYLELDSQVTMKSRPFNRRHIFWRLFFEANEQRLKGYRKPD